MQKVLYLIMQNLFCLMSRILYITLLQPNDFHTMKKLFFLFAILISTISYGQLIPKEFTIRTINDVDSALTILTKATKQQPKMPVFVEVTKEYIAQTRQVGKGSAMTWSKRTVEIPNSTYYENITKVYVRKGWVLNFLSTTTGTRDHILVKDKKMAEDAFAALLCLIKNSGNVNYEKIVAEISK